MTVDKRLDDETLERERSRCLSLYGAFAISANLILALKGLIANDPFMFAAGAGTAVAQGVNWAKGDKYEKQTIPTIIACAGIFAVGGWWAHNMHRMHFGVIKMGGVYAVKSSPKIAKLVGKIPPLMRLVHKLPGIKATMPGEALLGMAVISLLVDGSEQVYKALQHGGDVKTLSMGLATIAATIALGIGQHYFARAPAKQLADSISPRVVTLSAAPEL